MDKPFAEQKCFPATDESLIQIFDWIEDAIRRTALSTSDQKRLALAMEEAVVNVIRHAYPNQPGEVEIRATITPGKKIEFVIIDQGIPFDPFTAPEKQILPLEQMQEGGLGVLYIRKNVDTFHYERVGNQNILTLTKNTL